MDQNSGGGVIKVVLWEEAWCSTFRGRGECSMILGEGYKGSCCGEGMVFQDLRVGFKVDGSGFVVEEVT